MSEPTTQSQNQNLSVAIVIPNWNGEHLLTDCLNALMKALHSCGGDYEVIVVDDASTDRSVEIIRGNFPSVKLLVNERNEGFAKSANRGAAAASSRIVYLLNTDVIVGENFLTPVVRHFERGDVFAVSSESYYDNGVTLREGRKTVLLRNIWFYGASARRLHNAHSNQPAFSIMATGGHSAFNREKFLELGGFDSLFHPFYWEDSDICYRAWMRGWKVINEPASRVRHKSAGVISTILPRREINAIGHRNRMIFIWKNLSAWNILMPHFLGLTLRIVISTIMLDRCFWRSFIYAARRLPEILKKRKQLQNSRVLKDMQILRIVSSSSNTDKTTPEIVNSF
ncbi:MAG: glycosyltransferase family 2 protein [bacterium]